MHPTAPHLASTVSAGVCRAGVRSAASVPQAAADAVGFQIGWDHAHHGLVPELRLLQAGTAVDQGWRAARAVLGQRSPGSTRAVRLWLALRCTAWREGVDFDTEGLSASALARLQTTHCPVRRQPLGGTTGGADAPWPLRLNPDCGYRPGNVVMLSRTAAEAGQGCSVQQALRHARAAEAGGLAVQGLHGAAWRRLAVLLSFAQALPLQEAARLPLLLLPPPGLTPQSPVQALQLLLSLNFRQSGWSHRTRQLAAALPHDAQRTDFHLFVSALASRVLAGDVNNPLAGHAHACLEDAWRHERVQQRWQQLVLGLGDAGCASLCHRARTVLQQAQGRARQPAQIRACPAPTRPLGPEPTGADRAGHALAGGAAGDGTPRWRDRPASTTGHTGWAPRWPRLRRRSTAAAA